MKRLFLTIIILTITCIAVRSQSEFDTLTIPLSRNYSSGLLGSTELFMKDERQLSALIPDFLKDFLVPTTVEFKSISFDFSKMNYLNFKKGIMSKANFLKWFSEDPADTTWYENRLKDFVDDNIEMVFGKDIWGNLWITVDKNNDNRFDDGYYRIPKSELEDSANTIIRNIFLENIYFIKKGKLITASFPVDIKIYNGKSPGVKMKGSRKTVVSIVYTENLFGHLNIDSSKSIEVNIRKIRPDPELSIENTLYYIYSSRQKEPTVRLNVPALKLNDSVIIDKHLYKLLKIADDRQYAFCLKSLNEVVDMGFYEQQKIPYFRSTSLSGETISRDIFRGKYTLLDFWGSWCGPCIKSFPELRDLNNKYGKRNVQIVGVIYDNAKNRMSVDSLIKKNKLTWPQIYEFKDSSIENQIVDILKVFVFPTYVLINPEGVIIKRSVGLGSLDTIKKTLEDQLNGF